MASRQLGILSKIAFFYPKAAAAAAAMTMATVADAVECAR